MTEAWESYSRVSAVFSDDEHFTRPDEPEFCARDVFDRRRVVPEPVDRVSQHRILVLQPRQLRNRGVELPARAQRLGQPALADERIHREHTRREAEHAARPRMFASAGRQLRRVESALAHRVKGKYQTRRKKYKRNFVQAPRSASARTRYRSARESTSISFTHGTISTADAPRGCRSARGTVMIRVLPEARRGSSVGRAQH